VADFKLDRRMTLTIGKTVLQTVEPTLGKKGPRSQPNFFNRLIAHEVDDTPELESFAEGYGYAQW
jgi:hypothetical protein